MKPHANPQSRQQGVALIVVMLLLVIVSLLGVGASQISLLGERSSRNDRDAQVAWQAADAALTDATLDLRGSASSTRSTLFGKNDAAEVNVANFIAGCGATGNTKGLCALQTDGSAKPVWLTVNFTGTNSPTAAFGDFTGRNLKVGAVGVQPSQMPRYIVELVRDTGVTRDQSESNAAPAFRVTAMGFGPRDDIQAVLQMVYRN